MAQLAISKDYFQAYAALPRKAQRKADEFLTKFQSGSTSLAIHLEPIQRAVDAQLRSARIGDDYRIILRAPERGEVYLVLWADHHDEAYRWAATKQTAIHPSTGSLQIFDPVLAGQSLRASAREPSEDLVVPKESQIDAAHEAATLFAAFTDDQLFSAGVPRPLVPSVRAIHDEAELDLLLPHLPPEAAETLTGLAAGLSLDEALEEVLGRPPPVPRASEPPAPDVLDYGAALQRETTQRQFRLLDADLDLDAALNHPLDVWRVFLHPKQRRVAHARTKGPVRVLGGAGTGKTVVALHRAAFLAREVFRKPDDRILFTTFTVNLADDLRSQLIKLLGPDELARVDVIPIDAWASRYLRARGKSVRPAFEREQQEHFRNAFDVYAEEGASYDFTWAEWREVIQDQGITTEEGYVRAVRSHRGVPLTRVERRKLWPVFAAYREGLTSAGYLEPIDILRAARVELEISSEPRRYQSVVVDEAQDFSLDALRLVRAIAGPEHPDDLFLCGDAHQRIYGRPVALSHAGIQVRGRRSQTLRLNYRTTGAICRYATRTLLDVEVDDLDQGKVDRRGYISVREGPEPEVQCLASALDEERAVVALVQRLLTMGVPAEAICVMARTRGVLDDRFEPALVRAGVECSVLEKHEVLRPGVRLSTMHRAKGLEFATVILVDATKSSLPYPSSELRSEDPVIAAAALAKERCLLYVATSRARDDLYIFAHGSLSPLVPVPSATLPGAEEPKTASKPPPIATEADIRSTPLFQLPFPTRLLNWADARGVLTVQQLLRFTPDALLAERNLGRKTVTETRELVEKLLDRAWGEPTTIVAPVAALPRTFADALADGRWDEVRELLTEAQRAYPIPDLDLPARVVTFATERGLATLGDLAKHDSASLESASNIGRGSLRELVAALGRYEVRCVEDAQRIEQGLLPSFRGLVQELEPVPRLIVTRRSGLGGESLTLQELGEMLGFSRERARQIESKVAQALDRRPWGRLLRSKVLAEIAGGARRLSQLEADPFWEEAASQPEVVRFVVETVLGVGFVWERDEQAWLSPFDDDTAKQRERAAKTVLDGAELPAPLRELRQKMAVECGGLGEAFRSSVLDELCSELVLEGPPGEETVVARGRSKSEAVLVLLRQAAAPMAKEDIVAQLGRFNVPDEAILFDRGRLGLLKHFPDFERWRERLVPRSEQLVEQVAPTRQWSCAELLEAAREEIDVPDWLTAWGLAALIKAGSKLRYLGRLRVALPSAANESRVLVHEHVERLLREAGEPMTREEIATRVHERLGVSELALQQVLSRPQFVKVDAQRVGLTDRDIPGGRVAVDEALDHLEALFLRRGRGLSHFQAKESIASLSHAHAEWSEDLVASLLRSDGRFRSSQSGATGLATWDSTRVPTRLALVKAALETAGTEVSVDAVSARIEAHYGRPPSRNYLSILVAELGASLEGDWIRR
jgi:mRNA-degrading endonuclease RelE of RelBE toxin-antitoxin system